MSMHKDAVRFIRDNGGANECGGFIPSPSERRPAKDFALLMKDHKGSRDYDILSLRAVYRPKGDPAFRDPLISSRWDEYNFSAGNVFISEWPDGWATTINAYGYLMETLFRQHAGLIEYLHILRQFAFMEECDWARKMIEATGPYQAVIDESE
jgi:hypothetical protein